MLADARRSEWRYRLLRFSLMIGAALLLTGQPAAALNHQRAAVRHGRPPVAGPGTVGFPQDHDLLPLLADPKNPAVVSLLRGTFRSLDDPTGTGTTIGFGRTWDSFGLVRWKRRKPGNGIQHDVVGSIFRAVRSRHSLERSDHMRITSSGCH
jgi:hypothetical protein